MLATAEPWRLLVTPPSAGADNMALDQALADLYFTHSRPTLRFYRWSPPCVSVGFAQRLERDVDQATCSELGIGVVRRPTGGRAILHDQEITYSLVIAVDHSLIGGGSILQSYRAISEALRIGLEQLGVVAELMPRPNPRLSKSAACFDLSSDYEVAVGGRKLVGSAQARKYGVLLQHGSLLLHADPTKLARVLRLAPALSSHALAQRMIALDEVLGYLPAFDDVVAALMYGFEQAWSIKLQLGALSAAEHQRTQELVHQKYSNPAWTKRR